MNSSPRAATGILLLALPLLLAACAEQVAPNELSVAPLPPCSAEGSPFADEEFAKYDPSDSSKPPTYRWHEIYESQVKAVVDAHAKILLGEDDGSGPSARLQCTAQTYREMFPASGALQSLASLLPGFKGRAGQLSEMDIGAVLIEWLRVYECAMKEEATFVAPHVEQEFIKHSVKDATYGNHALEVKRRIAYIENALRSGRALTERLMTLIGGFSRLRPLAAELTCLERTSADIRNNLALLGDASTCLPRALNARGSLRDFDIKEEDE